MTKEFKKHVEWLEGFGYNPIVWIGGDWHQPMHLLSKLLIEPLSEKRPFEQATNSNVSFKISFDSMTEIAEEHLGIPALVTEKDLMTNYPNIFLAQLVQLVAMKNTLEKTDIDGKSISKVSAPKLVFEARNGMDAQFPRCPSCHEHVFFLQRLIVERAVWHRRCFKCAVCDEKLKSGGYKKTRLGYECISHSVRKILDEKTPSKSPRPGVAPPPVPIVSPGPTVPAATYNEPQDNYDTIEIETKRCSISSEDESVKEKRQKPVPPPKPKYLSSPRISQVLPEEMPSCSSDSGVSIGSSNTYDIVEDLPTPERDRGILSPPPLPVAPPRPKRASMLLTASMTPPTNIRLSRAQPPTDSRPFSPPTPAPRLSFKETKLKEEPTPPRSSNPFDEPELKINFDYDESKNPFADSDDDEQMPKPAPRNVFPASLLPGESDRPKSTPPPPPPTATSPIPKEEDEDRLTSEKLKTLRLSRKKKRAPLPPIMRRNIVFTENTQLEDASVIAAKVKKMDDEIEKVELEGKKIEMELLLKITTNPKDWYKLPRTEEYISTAVKLLDVLREQAYLQYSWKESYLNEVHSETDFRLRELIEKDLKDDYSQLREKQLLSLLVFIMDEKAKLTESHMEGADSRSRESSLTRKEKKSTMKLRMAILSKKLRNKKRAPLATKPLE